MSMQGAFERQNWHQYSVICACAACTKARKDNAMGDPTEYAETGKLTRMYPVASDTPMDTLTDLRLECLHLYYLTQRWVEAGSQCDQHYAKLLNHITTAYQASQGRRGVTSS